MKQQHNVNACDLQQHRVTTRRPEALRARCYIVQMFCNFAPVDVTAEDAACKQLREGGNECGAAAQ